MVKKFQSNTKMFFRSTSNYWIESCTLFYNRKLILSLCFQVVSFIIFFDSKIFHFLHNFNITYVFRLFFHVKYQNIIFFYVYLKPKFSAYFSYDI